MKKLSVWIQKVSKGWVVLSAMIIFVLFAAFVLPRESAKSEAYSAEMGSPDTSLYYTPQRLYRIAEAYGPDGRQAYIRARWTFDVAFPFVYGFFLTTTISWVFKRANLTGKIWSKVNLIPVAGVLFDFLENASTSIVMGRYPEPTAVIDVMAGILTSIKWLFVSGSFVILFLGMIFTIFQRRRKLSW